jgi:predicted house-cleaning noncanonical NTP pyrophosphatase (MazG superfamily)
MAEEYDKLVRDRIPEIIEGNGERPETHRVTGDEYERRLLDKLDEEGAEYRESREVEELAEVREEKAERRGRFADGVVLERVEE